MEAAKKDITLRKRQLIQASARKMFIWVAGASVIVGFAVVAAWFLFQQIMYTEKVLAAKAHTVQVLQANNTAAPQLANNIRALEASDALNGLKVNNEKAVQVILDALPSEDNPFALGASMQQVLTVMPGIKLESFTLGDNGSVTAVSPNPQAQVIPFTLSVSSSDPTNIKLFLKRLEASIRTIDVDNLQLEENAQGMTATIQGHAYYAAEKTIQLTNKVVPIQ